MRKTPSTRASPSASAARGASPCSRPHTSEDCMSAHATLYRARILDLFSETEVDGIAALGEERSFKRGEQLFGEAESDAGLYILLEGKVKSSLFERGHELEIKEYNAGD